MGTGEDDKVTKQAFLHRHDAKSAKSRQGKNTFFPLGDPWRSWRFGGESSLLSPCHSPLACWRSAGTDFPPGQKWSGGLGPCPSSGRQVAGSDPHLCIREAHVPLSRQVGIGSWRWRTIHAILGWLPLLLRVFERWSCSRRARGTRA